MSAKLSIGRAFGAGAVLVLVAGSVASAQPCAVGQSAEIMVSLTIANRLAPDSTIGDGFNQIAVGDVNNDGFDDIVIGSAEGALGEVGSVVRRGVVRVFSGLDGSLLREFTGNTWTNPSQIDGFGWRVACFDVNNDGFADVLVSANRINGGAGRITVFSGANGSVLLNAAGNGGDFGSQIVNVGDVNNDGRNEFVGTLPGFNPNQDTQAPGAITLHSGATGALLDFAIGGGFNVLLGRSVAVMNDIDNDGFDEIAVATERSVIVFPVNNLESGHWIRNIDPLAIGAADLALVAVGDVNNDGADDVGYILNGEYGVLSGVNGDSLLDRTPLLPIGSVVTPLPFDDVNGDGVNDFVVAVRDLNRADEQVLYVDATNGAVLARLVSPVFVGVDTDEAVFASGIAVGDVNNDGALDVVITTRKVQNEEAPFSETITALAFTAVPCSGDTNGDGVINFNDLNAVLSSFGQSGAGDTDCSGTVNFNDLNSVLSAFGTTCN